MRKLRFLRKIEKIVNGAKKKTNPTRTRDFGENCDFAIFRKNRDSSRGLVFSTISVLCAVCDFNDFCENCEFSEKSQKSQNTEKLEKTSPPNALRFFRKLRKIAKIAKLSKAREDKSPKRVAIFAKIAQNRKTLKS